MKGMLWRLAGLAGFVGLVSLVFWFGNDGLCGNQFRYEAVSPGRVHRVVAFERDCGATTGFSWQASIIGANDKLPNEPGNLLQFGDKEKVGAIEFDWIDDQHLMVRHSKFVELRKKPEVNGVYVSYKPFEQ